VGGRQVVIFRKIPHARFGPQGHTGLPEGAHVAVHGAVADAEAVGQFLGLHHALGLQVNEHGRQAVGAVHGQGRFSPGGAPQNSDFPKRKF